MRKLYCIKDIGIFKNGGIYSSIKTTIGYQVFLPYNTWSGKHEGWDYVNFADFDNHFTYNHSTYINNKIGAIL